MKKGKTPEIRCSFCGAGSSEVNSLIEGGLDVYICDKCVENASQILNQNNTPLAKGKVAKSSSEAIYKPSEIKSKLDEYVVGQDNTKKILSVAVYNHYKRIKNISDKANDVEIEKSNVLLLGPTGTGKTLLARTLAKILHVPFAIADATTITEAGYVGDDVETVLLQLIQNSDYDVVSSQRGIIYIDEIDKISRRSDSQSITRDVSGEGVQQALLKMLEGTRAGVPPKGGRKHPEQSLIYIDTKNILFICGGAFDGLEKIIANRMRQSSIGFTAQASNSIDDTEELLKHTEPDDLIKYGFIPELVGRLPIITSLQPLSDEALMNVLVAPKNAIVKQYKQLFDMEDVELEFEEDALHAIVAKAKERKTGARALRSIVEEVMLEIMYELPDRDDVAKCIITKESITENAPPRYELKSEQKVG